MNLYLLSQNERNGYDTYDSCVVCAESEDEAKRIHPREQNECFHGRNNWQSETWASYPENVTCKLIGTAADNVKKGVVCASFNAG